MPQNYTRSMLESFIPKTDGVYLITRKSADKDAQFIQKFNLSDEEISHVGLGLVNKGDLMVTHVMPNLSTDETHLKHESLASFYTRETSHLTIWEALPDLFDYSTVERQVRHFQQRKVTYDQDFQPDSDHLYCSELVAKVLNAALLDDRKVFTLTERKLGSYFAQVLEREIMLYYPADFFLVSGLFQKVLSLEKDCT